MASSAPARRVAHALLGECRRRDARMRDLLRSSSAMATLSAQDRSLAQRLAIGVTACSGILDHMIDSHLAGGRHLEPRVRDALRLATYELCWLSTPTPVAVSQGVELVRGVRRQATGLANAVLRKVADVDAPRRCRALERVTAAYDEPYAATVSIDDLTLVSGCPAWLLERIVADRGVRTTAMMALALVEPPPVYVAPNLMRHTVEQAGALLAAAGADPHLVYDGRAFELGSPSALATSQLVERADVVACDLAAQRVAAAVAPKPGDRVLEVGQGRGTKTILLENAALVAGGPAEIVGIDAEAFKVRVATERMATAGLARQVSCIVFDGRLLARDELPAGLADPFDIVLVDAPCSGSGTVRRHPEIAWSLKPAALDVERGLPELQLSLLAAAASRVVPGGLLAYATCSVLKAEDEDVVGRFLARPEGAAFELEDTLLTETTPKGSDTHFLARLRRHRP